MNAERNPHLLNDPNGGGGCVIGSSTPIHGYGSPPSGGGGGGGAPDMPVGNVGTPCPVPTPPWVKPPSNNGNSGMMTPESDVSSCSSPASTSFGANPQQQQQTFPPPQPQPNQHLLQQQHRSFYGSASFSNSSTGGASGYCSTNNNNAISSSTNSNSGMFYDSSGEVMDQSQYYHQHHHQQQHHFHQQQQHFQNNNVQHLQQKSGSSNNSPNLIDSNVGGGGDCVDHGTGGGNFYGFYNPNNNSGQYTEYHHAPQQQLHNPHAHHNHTDNFPSGDVSGNGGRMNQFYHHQHHRQDSSGSANSGVPVGHGNYFNAGGATPNSYHNSNSGTSTPPARYGSPMMMMNHGNNYGMHQQHHQNQIHLQSQIPLRRNSIESYSSEPGSDSTMHSNYTARFGVSGGCVNPGNMAHNLQQLNHHSHHQHLHQFPSPTGVTSESGGSTSGMVKREQCSGMTNRSSPSMNPMTPNAGCWSPHPPPPGGYFPSSSPNNSCSSSGSPNPCSSTNNVNANSSGNNFINPSYNSQSGCASSENTNCTGNFYHHPPVPTTQFKSCAYEQSQQHHDIKEGISSMKAASAVKHRSLSLSMPLPSYMEQNRDSSGNFVNHPPQRPVSVSHHPHLQNPNQQFSPMMDQQHHHHHHHCQTSGPGLVPPPEQNLLTPNSDDDIPFRAASAGGQSDLDSCYETMGDEGCSSTSTSVASHCMSSSGSSISMNTSGSSSCSGGAGMVDNNSPVGIASTTSDHNLHTMPMNHPDCQHHHHHHHQHILGSFPAPSSCMQSGQHQHHVTVTSMHHATMEMLELPNSTKALCSNNVDDLDDSSSDSDSVELHNVISAVVENSSIETPENTMMGDEGMNDGQLDLQDSQNIISTTTNEPEDQDNEDDECDDDDDDNCSESSMSHINSSFTADMFNENSLSNQNKDEEDDFPNITEEGNFIDDDEDNHLNKDATSEPAITSASADSVMPLNSSSSAESPCSSSPQKVMKRSFSEADKDNVMSSKTTTTTTASSSSSSPTCSSVGSISTFTFGASFNRMKSGSESRTSGGGSVSAGQIANDVEQLHLNSIDNKCEDESGENCGKGEVNSVSNKCNNGSTDNNDSVLRRRRGTGGCKAIADIIRASNVTQTKDENGRQQVTIPKGWKREIMKGAEDNVLYISPSDTKIRNLDELKNYIGSDGTCKCGLSCPLKLEVVFSFDPKVTNMTVPDEKENLKRAHAPSNSAPVSTKEFGRNDSSTSSSSSAADASVNTRESQDTRLLCNHKRKIPKAEDSPLISSTRDDLGDFGEKSKKRRLSVNESTSGEKLVSSGGPFAKDPITTSATHNESRGNNGDGNNGIGNTSNTTSSSSATNSSNSSSSHNVPVPFCQQSPDTTTQTPQTEMSPASSVCSDSSTILLSSAGSTSSGSRSLTSTPTPTLSSSTGTTVASASSSQKIGTSPSQAPCEFVWPSAPPPTLIQQAPTPQIWLNPTPFSSGSNSLTLNYVQASSSPATGSTGVPVSTTSASVSNSIVSTASTSTPTTSTTSTSSITPAKKPCPHPYPAKSVKRPSSPCPNIDVSKLPLEQNRPPLILPQSSAPKIVSSTPSPLLPAIAHSSITPTLPTLSTVVSNPNILFTVTSPLMAASSTPTLPILPLLTTGKLSTVGSIDTTCGAPTLVTTLQQSPSIFGQITTESSGVTGTPILSSISPILPIKDQTSGASSTSSGVTTPTSQKPTVVKSDPASVKKNDETTASQNKAKEPSSSQKVSSSKEPAKSPLQLAQDIISRFEKKSGEKDTRGKSPEKSIKSAEPSKESKDKIQSPKTTKPATKDQSKEEKDNKSKSINKTENNGPVVTSATKKDTPISVSVPSSTEQNKAEKERNKSETTNAVTKESIAPTKTAVASSSGEAEPAKSTNIADAEGKIGKGPVDATNKIAPVVSTVASIIISSASMTPTIASPLTSLSMSIARSLQENTIITSQSPLMSSTPFIFKDGLQLTDQGLTLTTSVAGSIPTISLSGLGNQIIQTSGGPVSCGPSIPTFGQINNGTNQFILQAPSGPHGHADQNAGANSTFLTTSAAGQPRFTTGPILQTIQPLFLNSAGPAGGPLIISQPTPGSHDPTQQQSFIYDQNGTPTGTIDANGTYQQIVQPATTTMVLDPSGLCAGNPNLNSLAGAKKKKKRLSKKQQQQQAQLQLQQQFILQQIQAQQQAAAAAAIAPLTIFPQSFNLGPQGFSLQPTMNFFPAPTILTLPNLILNPADGTLFIQPSTPLQATAPTPMPQTTTMKLGQYPLQPTTTIQASPNNPQNIAPKKDSGSPLIQHEPLKPSTTPGLDPGSDDSRQNPTPDSSTNDLQLGLINVATGPTPQSNTITLNIPTQTTTTVLHNPSSVVQKKNSKSRAVTSSSANVKRILPQKQILPKIDSTTPSTTENVN